jgi:hypothetical protein
VNVLDEVPQSYSHQGFSKLDQRKYTVETQDHEFVNSKVVKLFSKVCAFCEEKGHVIIDCLFFPFHMRADIARHVELQNVVGTLMDQSQDQEPRIFVIQNRLKNMELGG